MSIETNPVLAQRPNFDRAAATKAADDFIDQATECCNKGAKKVAHDTIGLCGDSLESLQGKK